MFICRDIADGETASFIDLLRSWGQIGNKKEAEMSFDTVLF